MRKYLFFFEDGDSRDILQRFGRLQNVRGGNLSDISTHRIFRCLDVSSSGLTKLNLAGNNTARKGEFGPGNNFICAPSSYFAIIMSDSKAVREAFKIVISFGNF
jgi:hypothetical protein